MKQKTKILIVEDVEAMLRVLADKFEREGFMVFEATNGLKGFQIATEHLPDVVLTDVFMPVLGGIEMCQKLRANSKTASIPIIFLSILSGKEYEREVEFIPNVLGYLWKNDLSMQDIVNFVKNMLEPEKT